MGRAYFTVDEVEALIPALERIFVQVLQLRAGLRALGQKLNRAGVSPPAGGRLAEAEGQLQSADAEVELESDADTGPPAVRQARAVFRGLDEALADELERVRSLGGEVKDLDLALVDFPSQRNGEDILLCWKLGEKTLGYWHSVDGGYSSRRPIDAHITVSAPTRLD